MFGVVVVGMILIVVQVRRGILFRRRLAALSSNEDSRPWGCRERAPLDPANANRYLFAGGDPINGQDPSGQLGACANASGGYGIAAATQIGGAFVLAGSLSVEPETLGGSTAGVIAGSAVLFGAGAGATLLGEANVLGSCPPEIAIPEVSVGTFITTGIF